LHSPIGELYGDFFAFFLLELLVDLGVNNPVILVLLPISTDVRVPTLPAKPLCFLLFLLCIEVSKRNLLFVETYLEVFGSCKLGPLLFISFVPDYFLDKRSI
jgi:hypothetical protein